MPGGLIAKLKLEATFWLGRRQPACDELARVMSESLERRLTLRERVTLRLHFLICSCCKRYLGQLRTMRGAARSQTDDALPEARLSDEARERIRRALSERGE